MFENRTLKTENDSPFYRLPKKNEGDADFFRI
jgi:hypothetical protein